MTVGAIGISGSNMPSISSLDAQIASLKQSAATIPAEEQVFSTATQQEYTMGYAPSNYGMVAQQNVPEKSNSSLAVFSGVGTNKVLEHSLNKSMTNLHVYDDIINSGAKGQLLNQATMGQARAAANANFLTKILGPKLGDIGVVNAALNSVDDVAGASTNALAKTATGATKILRGVPLIGPAIQFGVGLATGQSIAEAGTRTACSTVGAAIGQTLIPIPIVGAVIGGLVGDWVGNKGYNWLKHNLV